MLCHVDAARNERKARDDEQHRADIPRLMLWVDGEEQRCQPEQPGIDQTRRSDGQGDAAKQRQVPLRQPRADILPNACAQKGQQHLDRPAAEQKREPAAGKRGCQSQLQRGIAAACLRDLVQLGVQVVRGHVHAVEREALDKALKLVKLRGVDAGCRQRQRLREAVLTVGAGVLDGQQPDVGGAHETERLGNLVHGAAHTPCAGAAREQQQPDPADDTGPDGQRHLRDGQLFLVADGVVPRDLHMVWFDDRMMQRISRLF